MHILSPTKQKPMQQSSWRGQQCLVTDHQQSPKACSIMKVANLCLRGSRLYKASGHMQQTPTQAPLNPSGGSDPPSAACRVTKVREFQRVAKLCEADGHMQQKLKQLLKLSKEKWDAACEHAKTAVQVPLTSPLCLEYFAFCGSHQLWQFPLSVCLVLFPSTVAVPTECLPCVVPIKSCSSH